MHDPPLPTRLFRALSRLASMKRGEVVDRFRQEVRKRTEAMSFAVGVDPTRHEVRPRQQERPKFFFDREDVPRRLTLLRERVPEQVKDIVETADRICRHRFDVLGYKDLSYGDDIDWHLDPVHGKRAPTELWFKVPYLDFETVGDAKIIWELNRHQHLVALAKAYRLTDDQRYASELVKQWNDWQEKNPYPRGINWASSLEVAFRSMSWLWVDQLLEGTPALTAEFRERWLRAMARSGRHIASYLSTYFSPNTHLIGEAAALFFIGTLCPELASSSKWKQRGWEIIVCESRHQVRADGFFFEQSTYYHVYALDFFLHAHVLASLNGISVPAEFTRTIEAMLEALAILCRAGDPPRWGDDDGGRLFDPRRNRPEHLADPLATGAALFGRGDFKYLAQELREETIWLLGEDGVANFDRGESKLPCMNSIALIDSGLYAMSSGEGRTQAIIDCGPQGALSAGHGHADALSLTLQADGNELLGDPGTFEYLGEALKERNKFRGTAAHNTLQIDGKSQSEEQGPFAWRSLVAARCEEWITARQFDFFVGSHDGYSKLGDGARHQRTIFFRKPRFWLVRDSVSGAGRHQLDVRWHVNPQLSLASETADHFFFSGKANGLFLFPLHDDDWVKSVESGSWSGAYGEREAAPAVRFTSNIELPTEFVTLLMPSRPPQDSDAAHGKLTRVNSDGNTSAYQFIEGNDQHYFVFAQAKGITFHEFASDADFMYCSYRDERLSLLVFCNCTTIKFCDTTIVATPDRLSWIEISQSASAVNLSSSDSILQVPEALLSGLFEAREMSTAPLNAGHL